METVEWAREVAAELLGPLGDRWLHVQAVAARSGDVASGLSKDHRALLVASAWLHDIGYAPQLVNTGFHPLDGASFLLRLGQDQFAELVAHHSCADIEAQERGLLVKLACFVGGPPVVAQALTYCDMTTGPTGEPVTLAQRLQEIEARYGSEHVVARSIRRARPCLDEAVRQTETLLAARQPA